MTEDITPQDITPQDITPQDITPQDISHKDILEDFVVKYHFEDYNTNKKNYVRTLVKENIYKEK